MKKIIPALAVVAGAAALVAYKLKKDEEKRIVDLDQGLLEDEFEETDLDEDVQSEVAECMECAKEKAEDVVEDMNAFAHRTVEEGKEAVEDFVDTVKDKAEDIKEEFDAKFPALLKSEVAALKEIAKQNMDKMLQGGDVHENERPVQHTVTFKTAEDMENFKNEVINKGFVVTRGDSDLELIILHITPIDDIKLMSNILYIASEAKQYHGEYQGWSSKIIY